MHVGRQPNRPRVVLDRAHQGLPNPPDRVGGELEAAPVVELLDGADQPQVPLLDQIRERQAQVPVVLGDGDYELEVVLDEAVLDRASCARAHSSTAWTSSSIRASWSRRSRPRALLEPLRRARARLLHSSLAWHSRATFSRSSTSTTSDSLALCTSPSLILTSSFSSAFVYVPVGSLVASSPARRAACGAS